VLSRRQPTMLQAQLLVVGLEPAVAGAAPVAACVFPAAASDVFDVVASNGPGEGELSPRGGGEKRIPRATEWVQQALLAVGQGGIDSGGCSLELGLEPCKGLPQGQSSAYPSGCCAVLLLQPKEVPGGPVLPRDPPSDQIRPSNPPTSHGDSQNRFSYSAEKRKARLTRGGKVNRRKTHKTPPLSRAPENKAH